VLDALTRWLYARCAPDGENQMAKKSKSKRKEYTKDDV